MKFEAFSFDVEEHKQYKSLVMDLSLSIMVVYIHVQVRECKLQHIKSIFKHLLFSLRNCDYIC